MSGNDAAAPKRIQIIEAATVVFSQKGFYKAKVEEIAEAAMVGKGTVYEYFKSKQDLFQQMLIFISQKYEQAVKEQVQQVDSFSDKLRVLIEANFNFSEEYKNMAKILLIDAPPMSEELHQIIQQSKRQNLQRLAALIDEAINKGQARRVNSYLAAQVILGALAVSGGQVMFEDEFTSSKESVTELVDIILNGIGY
ncbi:MAG: TetR/AcrR family transcriptional regulator [Bacillota bacterium]|nr:TetR/AcrR family transcriptional regulator [Bacillota bacterium]